MITRRLIFATFVVSMIVVLTLTPIAAAFSCAHSTNSGSLMVVFSASTSIERVTFR